MIKKIFIIFLASIICISLCGCNKKDNPQLSVGYIACGETLYDHDINESVWRAVTNASSNNEVTAEYVLCTDTEQVSVNAAISDLYEKGCRMIFVSEYKIAQVIEKAQKQYRDCMFVCVGFSISNIASNTLCISFNEHEAAFVAAVAAATELKNAQIGCILGMDVPSSQRYLSGFINGLEYANAHLGTKVYLSNDKTVFIGSYNDSSLAFKIASEMYSSGIACIFSDGGNTGDGVFDAAKVYRTNQQISWVLATQTDNCDKGLIGNGNSVTITSAMFNFEKAVHYSIESFYGNTFKGGRLLKFGALQDGISIAKNYNNLSQESLDYALNILEKIKSGEIILKDPTSLID